MVASSSTDLTLERQKRIRYIQQQIAERSVDEGCWIWPYGTNDAGYGKVTFNGSDHLVHRTAYELYHQEELGKSIAMHSCDNVLCFNPTHIHGGTYSINNREAIERGRRGPGFSFAAITEMRQLHQMGSSKREISTMYRISVSYLSKVLRGESRKAA